MAEADPTPAETWRPPAGERGGRPVRARQVAAHVAALAVGSGGLGVYALVAPEITFGPLTAPVGALLAYAFVVGEVLLGAALTPRYPKRAMIAVGLLGVGLAGLVFLPEGTPAGVAAMLVTPVALGFGTVVGGVVGGAIERPGHLVVVALVSAMVDAFSVMHPAGPTAQLVEVEAAVSVLLLPWPVLGTADIIPVLGIGDIAFAALYTVAARRHGLPVGRTLAALAVGFLLTMGVVIVSGTGVPALPFLGLCVVAVHPAARAVPKEDERKALLGVIALGALFGALFVLRQG